MCPIITDIRLTDVLGIKCAEDSFSTIIVSSHLWVTEVFNQIIVEPQL